MQSFPQTLPLTYSGMLVSNETNNTIMLIIIHLSFICGMHNVCVKLA